MVPWSFDSGGFVLLRDPVHGLVTFEGREGQLIERLLATREVQRLRRVRQLGLASFVYPGAEHTRFAHALGAAYVMSRLLLRLRDRDFGMPRELRIDAEATLDAVAAALLHDLGHGPFSHLFEDALPGARSHEDWTHDIIVSADTEIRAALESFSPGMASRVGAMLRGSHRLPYLPSLVSGVFDVDRADYLLRDSHATGVRYGVYDLDWLLQSFRFAEHAKGWVLAIEGRKGLPPIESFFTARYAMYQQVYHHKAVRAAESLVRALFGRLGALLRQGDDVPFVPPALRAAAVAEAPRLSDYIAMDDATLLNAIEVWTSHPDPLLARLSLGLRERRLPKTVPLREGTRERWEHVFERACEIAQAEGHAPEFSVWLDVADDVPYEEPEDDTPDGLFVWRRHRPLARLGDVSFLLQQLRNKRLERPRLIFDPSLSNAIGPLMDEVME